MPDQLLDDAVIMIHQGNYQNSGRHKNRLKEAIFKLIFIPHTFFLAKMILLTN